MERYHLSQGLHPFPDRDIPLAVYQGLWPGSVCTE